MYLLFLSGAKNGADSTVEEIQMSIDTLLTNSHFIKSMSIETKIEHFRTLQIMKRNSELRIDRLYDEFITY